MPQLLTDHEAHGTAHSVLQAAQGENPPLQQVNWARQGQARSAVDLLLVEHEAHGVAQGVVLPRQREGEERLVGGAHPACEPPSFPPCSPPSSPLRFYKSTVPLFGHGVLLFRPEFLVLLKLSSSCFFMSLYLILRSCTSLPCPCFYVMPHAQRRRR